jgi:hypothetical protein
MGHNDKEDLMGKGIWEYGLEKKGMHSLDEEKKCQRDKVMRAATKKILKKYFEKNKNKA